MTMNMITKGKKLYIRMTKDDKIYRASKLPEGLGFIYKYHNPIWAEYQVRYYPPLPEEPAKNTQTDRLDIDTIEW